jgi:acyl carrier protein
MLLKTRGGAACKQRYSEKQSIVLDRSNETVADRVAALVRKVLDREEINKRVGPDDDLRASGLSSLGLVNLMLSVETEFDLKIPERDMTPTNFRSIMRIAELVDALSQTSAATA